MPLFLSVTEHEEQSNLIVTFYFNFVPSAYNKPQVIETDNSFHHSSVAKSPGKHNDTPGKKEKGMKGCPKDTFTFLRISTFFDETGSNVRIRNLSDLCFRRQEEKSKNVLAHRVLND